jgi:hypothetical protein
MELVMHDDLERFLEKPTAARYRRVRRAVLQLSESGQRWHELGELAGLCKAGRYRQAARKADSMMPYWALSPRVHFFAAQAAENLKRPEDAELERFLFGTCIDGLLSTGDGTAERPYLVTYVSDESDLLMATGRRGRQQQLVEGDVGCYDAVTCDDGREVWFDVSDVYGGAPLVPLEELILPEVPR